MTNLTPDQQDLEKNIIDQIASNNKKLANWSEHTATIATSPIVLRDDRWAQLNTDFDILYKEACRLQKKWENIYNQNP